jgi:hypothetical protein
MGYRRFEDLPVWNDAIDLATRTFAFTATGRRKGFAGLRDQIDGSVGAGRGLHLEQHSGGIRARDEAEQYSHDPRTGEPQQG